MFLRSSAVRAALLVAAGLFAVGCSSSNDNNLGPDSGTPDSGTVQPLPDSGTPDAGPSFKLTILHTNDLHSYVESQGPSTDYSPLTANDDETVGGFARLAARISAERAAAGSDPVLLLDSGDFMMGTLFQTLGLQDAVELTEMQHMGYDAITFGNHEFDFTPAGLAGILNAAAQHGFTVPIVASNIQFSGTAGDAQLAAFATPGSGAPTLIVSKLVKTLSNGLKVGIFGMMGKNAVTDAPLAAPVKFADQKATAQAMVDELRNTDKVDLVIMLSHGGSHADNTGEDVDLANAVSGIDVIISGHTHDALPTPLVDNHTVIVQSGAYGTNLGELKLTVKPGQAQVANVDSYQLIKNDDSVAGDSDTNARIQGYIADIDTNFAPAAMSYGKVLAETSFDLPKIQFQESGLGDLVTDAYRTVANAQLSTPAAIAIEANGPIRIGLQKGATGRITFADLYNVLPLGIGPDQLPGYPLVSFYVNGKDIKAGLEVSAMAKDWLNDTDVFLQVSGLTYTYDATSPNYFFRVQSASIGGQPVDFNDTSTCYQVVTSQYTALLLTKVSAATGGLLSVTAKESDCSTSVVSTDPTFSNHIIKFKGTSNELHAWQALAGYVGALPDTNSDSIPDVPSAYSGTQGRINAQ